ncbi:hypothetical protein J1605_018086 [Eschrichtius robustus]|uniref:Uncharacterized protein n=1 Tax=Eschrichtius robustus TaxID=9764 RepID=A0AB34HY66_ESCRO|nr:hypothetical protein J1605_018086 [Eschrichtius robustus]
MPRIDVSEDKDISHVRVQELDFCEGVSSYLSSVVVPLWNLGTVPRHVSKLYTGSQNRHERDHSGVNGLAGIIQTGTQEESIGLKEEEGCGCLAVQSLKSETAWLPQLALCGHDGPELGHYFHRFRNVTLSLSLDLMYQ